MFRPPRYAMMMIGLTLFIVGGGAGMILQYVVDYSDCHKYFPFGVRKV